MTPEHWKYIEAARVPDSLKSQVFGEWSISRVDLHKLSPSVATQHLLDNAGVGIVTFLKRMTLATLHLDGETVMEDSFKELRRHLPIWIKAEGNVLITGLGLGCVVRGLLAKPTVRRITVIEIDRQILRVVGHQFQGNGRVELIHADAMKWEPGSRHFDFAWHDLWCPDNKGLQPIHAHLIKKFWNNAHFQGAWAFPRCIKNIVNSDRILR